MLGLGLSLAKSTTVRDQARDIVSAYTKRVIAAGGIVEGEACMYQKLKALSLIP